MLKSRGDDLEKNWKALDKGIPGLDIEKGIARFNGDVEAYILVLRSYAKNTAPLIKASKVVDKENLIEYESIVHGIKGSSRSIFALEIGDTAEKLENAARAGDYNYIITFNTGFSIAVQRLISYISELVEEIDADNQKPVKERPDTKTLEKLLHACENYEMNKVDEAIEELESYSYKSNGDLVIWLRENTEQMNFDEIIKKLSNK